MRIAIDMGRQRELSAAFARAPALVVRELMAAVTDVDGMLMREVSERLDSEPKITTSGNLRDSLLHQEQVSATGAIGVVGSSANYAQPVEFGTRPHAVSRAGRVALAEWAQRKFNLGEKEARGVAFLVARKIRRVGTKPKRMFDLTFEAQEAEVRQKFADAVDRIVVQLGGAN